MPDSPLLHVSCVFGTNPLGDPLLSVLLFLLLLLLLFVVCIKKNSNHFTGVLPTCCLLAFILLHGILSIVPLALVYASEGNFT